MPVSSDLWPQVTGSNVLVWAATDRFDSARRIALYKNRAGIQGRLSLKQLAALGETMESLPVIKTATQVAAALRVGYPPQFRWDYFDFILSSTTEAQDAALAAAVAEAKQDLLSTKGELVTEIKASVSHVFRFRGTKETYEDLPTSNNTIGDVWQVASEGYPEYAWVEDEDNAESFHWEFLGKIVDLSPYLEKTEYEEYKAAMNLRVQNIENVKANKFGVAFVRADQSITLVENTKYYIKATAECTLPASAVDGAEIILVALPGGTGTTVIPANGTTLNGGTTKMALNASVLPTVFVFDAQESNWIAY